ncbi:NADH:flavin oxidoreductase [Tessaracoccus sp. MC1679]|uniref:NADH:flavin oxidoreductase n=1 Tax=Tessaracoccus sp. MC1679 TaxID=2760313 RepID=UPI0015FEFE8C|nr:NADH:flavin oxidoreductase [Tessaracoccus sp. MC1679]
MTKLSDSLDFSHGPAWRNRLALAPLTNKQSNPDGTLSDTEINWLLARARHGFGMVMTAAAYVAQPGKAWNGQLGISDESHLAGLERLAAGIREAGAASLVQIHHGGAKADPDASGEPAVGPFDDASTGARALSTAEIEDVVARFAAAAARAEQAGFDGVQLHGAHGYLLCQFLDAHNTRDDGYGGDLHGRSRILRETIAAVRAATSSDFHLGLRLSTERFGLSTPEIAQLSGELMAEGGLDHLDLSLWDVTKLPEGAADGDAPLVSHFVDLPRGGTRLGIAGKVGSGPTSTAALATGVDFVVVGRAAIADQRIAERILADAHYPGPSFPVSKQQLRDNCVGEPFVEYFSTGWPQLVAS